MGYIVQLDELGGPEVLKLRENAPAPLKPGELRLRQTAIGFNYLDVYLRTGVYKMPLPAVLGTEAAGVVTEVGGGVTGFAVGDRIAYTGDGGAYASERSIDAKFAIRLPDDVSDEAAAALLFKGQTAHMLLTRVYPVRRGDTIVVHSAAGGVGSALTRWIKSLGGRVIGTVGSRKKVEAALANGCNRVAVIGEDDLPMMVREETSGEGAAAVYDAVGRDTFEASLNSLREWGVFASYGVASGDVPPIEARQLGNAGSIYFNRPNVYRHIATEEGYRRSAEATIEQIQKGILVPLIGARFSLAEIAQAHRLAEDRSYTGAIIITP